MKYYSAAIALSTCVLGACSASSAVPASGGPGGGAAKGDAPRDGREIVTLQVHKVTFPARRNCPEGDESSCGNWDTVPGYTRPDIAVRLVHGFTPIAMTMYENEVEGTEVDLRRREVEYNFDLDGDRTAHEAVTLDELVRQRRDRSDQYWLNIVDIDGQIDGDYDLPEDGEYEGVGDATYHDIMASCPLVDGVTAANALTQGAVDGTTWKWTCTNDSGTFTAEIGVVSNGQMRRVPDSPPVGRVTIEKVTAPISKDIKNCDPANDDRELSSGRCVWDSHGTIQSDPNEWYPDLKVRLTVLEEPLGAGERLAEDVPLEGYTEFVDEQTTVRMVDPEIVGNGRFGTWGFGQTLVVTGLTQAAMLSGRVFIEFLDEDQFGDELMSRCYFGSHSTPHIDPSQLRQDKLVCPASNGLGGADIVVTMRRDIPAN